MTQDQLRALAEALRPMAAAPCFDGIDIDRAADYLRACAEQRPDGWRLVPAEPTEAMKSAGGHVNSEWLNDDAPLYESRYAMPMDGVWSAMLAAAPAVPQAEPTEAQITAAAKELCQCHAEVCGVDPDDTWKVYCDQFRTEATRVLRAAFAHGIGGSDAE